MNPSTKMSFLWKRETFRPIIPFSTRFCVVVVVVFVVVVTIEPRARVIDAKCLYVFVISFGGKIDQSINLSFAQKSQTSRWGCLFFRLTFLRRRASTVN